MARFLVNLHILRKHYPEYSDRIHRIFTCWELSKLVRNGWLDGGISRTNRQILQVQEARLGYKQYAAPTLKLWNTVLPDTRTREDAYPQLRFLRSERYKQRQPDVNRSIDINTNAIVLESLLYLARGQRSLIF